MWFRKNALLEMIGSCIVSAVLFTTGAAYGTDPSADADVAAQAQQLYKEGIDATKVKQWDKARTFLLSAWRIHQHWKIAINLGLAEYWLGRWRDAAEHLTFAVSRAPADKLAGADRADTNKMLHEAAGKVGSMKLSVSPPGAEVLVDGSVIQKAPVVDPIFLEPGRHVLGARLVGYEAAQQEVTAVPGKGASIVLSLVLAPSAEKKGPATIPPKGPRKEIVYAGIAGAGASLVIGFGLMGGSFAKASERDNVGQCKGGQGCLVGPIETIQAVEQERVQLANGARAGFIVAGALGAATLTYYLVTSTKAKAERKGMPVFAPLPGGFAAIGQW